MADLNTLRILEIDGGGERGYLPLNFLIKFIDLWGINPAELYKYFDVICGTSIGGILALGLCTGKDPNDLLSFFTTQGPYIFSTNGTPSNRVTYDEQFYSITVSGIPFYATDTGSSYGSALLVSTIEDIFGLSTMQSLLTNTIIPTYSVEFQSGSTDIENGTYTLCSNINYPDFVAQNELISNVALATSAAPFYLPSVVISNTVTGTLNGRYIDGGVYQNNPASFGRNLAAMIKPTANRCCILSLGTGLGGMGFNDPTTTTTRSLLSASADPVIGFWNLLSLFNISSAGGQESVAKNLYLQSNYTLDQFYYYRFQPQLDLTKNTELDNTTSEILTYYEDTATSWYNNDIDNITTFIGHLTA